MAKTLALGKRLPFGGGAAAAHVSRPPPPTLHQLFSRTAPQAESSGEIDRISEDEEDDAAAAQADVQTTRQGGSPGRQSLGNKPQDSATRSPQNAFASLSGEPLPPSPLHLLLQSWVEWVVEQIGTSHSCASASHGTGLWCSQKGCYCFGLKACVTASTTSAGWMFQSKPP